MTAEGGEAGAADADFLLELLGGKGRAQAISTVAALGVADRLADGPRAAGELAAELGCDASALESLLLLAAGLGFFACPAPGVFALTERGAQLRADALGPLAAFVGAPEQWDPWSRLRETVRTRGGPTPFAATFGTELYPWLERDPTAAERYDQAIDAFTRHEARALCAAHDLSEVRDVLDVGGGRGTLLFELLGRWPHLRGTLYDQPHVVERAREALPERLAGRVALVGGDFHEAVPAGHERIVLKHVLHNWDDERAVLLLSRCAAALAEDGRLLVIETVLLPGARPDLARLLDLEMRVLTGGRARRKPELRRLLQRAGLALEATDPLGGSRLLVARRAR